MSANRARTRAIRARMAETGEPYTMAARRHDEERADSTLVIDEIELRGTDAQGVPEFSVLASHREEVL